MVELKNNIQFELRDERGKLVTRRESHNIWLTTGRQFLASLISYATLGPDTTERDDRIRYMGFGIGGARQTDAIAAVAPYATHYPGTNTQTDVDFSLARLERPVRISWVTGSPTLPMGAYPALTYDPDDVFLKQVVAPPVFPSTTSCQFTCILGPTDISADVLLTVPLSEIGLFTNASNPNTYASSPMAYDTFDPIEKSGLFTLTVLWEVRF